MGAKAKPAERLPKVLAWRRQADDRAQNEEQAQARNPGKISSDTSRRWLEDIAGTALCCVLQLLCWLVLGESSGLSAVGRLLRRRGQSRPEENESQAVILLHEALDQGDGLLFMLRCGSRKSGIQRIPKLSDRRVKAPSLLSTRNASLETGKRVHNPGWGWAVLTRQGGETIELTHCCHLLSTPRTSHHVFCPPNGLYLCFLGHARLRARLQLPPGSSIIGCIAHLALFRSNAHEGSERCSRSRAGKRRARARKENTKRSTEVCNEGKIVWPRERVNEMRSVREGSMVVPRVSWVCPISDAFTVEDLYQRNLE